MSRIAKQVFTPGTNLNYTYDNQSKINKIIGFVNSTSHDAFGNPSNRTYNSSKLSEFSYDNKGRINEIKTGNLQNLSYSYDAIGNIIRINDSANGRLYNMSYDFLDRLTNASIGGINYVYSYNEIGSILKIVGDNVNTTKFVYGSSPVHAPSKIITNDAGTDVNKLKELYSNAKQRIISFFLSNEKNSTITNANWSVDFESSNKVNSTVAFNLTSNETIWVIAGYNYNNAGSYRINVTGKSSINSIDFENVTIKFGAVISNLTISNMNTSNITFKLGILGNMNDTSQNINWSCSEGLTGGPFTLTGNASRVDTMSNNYSSPGIKTFSCTTTSVDGNDTESIEFEIKGIKIENYNSTSIDENTRMVNFTIKNYWMPSAVEWYIASDGQTFTNTTSTLGTNGTSLVSQTINYSTDGRKEVIINITSGSITDYYNESLTLEAIRINDFDSINLTATNRLLQFFIKNNWPENQSINWNATNPSVVSNNVTNITSGESVLVLIVNNYTAQGINKPQITAYNNTFTTSFADRILVKVIEILRHLTLFENQNNTISEIVTINNLGLTNISWSIDTGEQNISSIQQTTLNNSESVFIIIQNNYTNSNIYVVKHTVNSTLYNDTSTTTVTS